MKVLLVRFSSAGDVLIAGRLISALKKAGHEPHFLTKPDFRDAASAAGAARIYTPELKGITDYFTAAARLSAEHYGAVIDLHGTFRSVFMTHLVKAGRKAFYSKNALKRRLMAGLKWFLGGKTTPVVVQYMNTAARAVPEIAAVKTQPRRRGKIKNILVHTGAKWPLKRWPYFEGLVVSLAKQKGLRVTVTGVKDEVENYGKMLYHKSRNVRDLTGKTTFKQLLSEIKKAGLFIGNDTAAAHAAKLYGVPAIVILGPTVQEFGFITEDEFAVAENKGLLCRPCHVHGGSRCVTGGFECMREIKAADVMAAVKNHIKNERRG